MAQWQQIIRRNPTVQFQPSAYGWAFIDTNVFAWALSWGTSAPIRQYFRMKEISPSHPRSLLSDIRSELEGYKIAIQVYPQQCHKFLLCSVCVKRSASAGLSWCSDPCVSACIRQDKISSFSSQTHAQWHCSHYQPFTRSSLGLDKRIVGKQSWV